MNDIAKRSQIDLPGFSPGTTSSKAFNRTRISLLCGVLTIFGFSSFVLQPAESRASLSSYYLDRSHLPLLSSSPGEPSAKAAIAYMAQVMDQFHDRVAVYDDVSSAGNHFFAWTKFPDGNAPVNINGSFTDNPHSGATSIKCSFADTTGMKFGGFVLQNGVLEGTDTIPQPNFGTKPNAGINLTGATALTFWARGKQGGEVVDFFLGGVGWNPDTGSVNNPCTPSLLKPCPFPDSTKAIKITKTLTNQWQQFRIELTDISLSYVIGGFGWGVDGAKNLAGAEFYLDDIQYELNSTRLAQRLNEPHFLRSFATLPFQVQPPPVNDFDLVLRNSAFTYDNAVALLAFLADGSDDSLRRARLIGDAFVYASQHDRAYNDGRLRSDYSAGDISLPPGWTPNGRLGTVPISGFYDEAQQKFIEIEQKAVDTGNNTWAMIALLALYRQTSNPSYLATARDLGNFIHTFRNDTGTYQGFQGGLDDYPETPMGTRRAYASTEHNLDVYAAFTRMWQITGEPQWQSDAQHAQQFVEAMWDAQKRCYLAGTTDPSIRNQSPNQLPLDVQAWSTLALPNTLALHPEVLQCAEQNHRNTNNGFSGFDFNDDKDGVWFEGTGQMATAYAFARQSTAVTALRQDLSRAQGTLPFGNNGGIAAASRDGLTTGFSFEYFVRQHIGATAWNVFAQLGDNPFYQTTAPAIGLSAPTYQVNESGSDVVITVVRTGDATLAATIDYATSDNAGSQNCNVFNGKASSRCDYLATFGTLHFAANETSKTISIPIVDDTYPEGPETFTITLTNPSGALPGSPAVATITITDNESVPGPNPIDIPVFFVRQHYLDFLNREPDSSGLGFWTNTITSCGSDQQCIEVKRINASGAFFLSIEFQQTGYLVYRIYKASVGNLTDIPNAPVPIKREEFLPDTQEIGNGVIVNQGNWQQQLESNKQAFTLEFVQRSRFMTAFPTTMTPAQFVDKLFSNAGVTPSPPDRNAAIAEFGSATNSADVTSRSRALRDVAENATLNSQEFNKAFVLMQYFGYLRRNPYDPPEATLDYSGFNFWLGKLNSFGGNYISAEMVKAFISSDEYRHRFGP